MKILQVITRLIHGGAQRVVVDTCAHLVQQGHDVHLAFGPIFGPEGSLLEDARASGATLHEIPTLVRQVSPINDWRSYRALRRLIRALKPDAVHTHSSKAGILGRAAAWKERTPLVLHTVHGLPFHDRQSKLVHDAYVALERFAAQRCHHLVAVSEAMVEAFVEHDIAPRERFTVIPSGVDVGTFSVERPPRQDYGRVVAIVARLDPLKGHRDLIEAVAPLAGVRLLCIGDGWDRPNIEAIAREKLGDRATFTGLVPPPEVARLLAGVDVNVLPSYQEGQGLTLAEALLAGCAVVGYDIGGIGSVCIDNVTGRLVPTGDKLALRDAIRDLLDHPDKAADLTRRGQQHVRDHFSSTGMVKQIEALYHNLIKSLNRGGAADAEEGN